MNTLQNKVVAITGGARGIGAATARAAAAAGARVAIGDLDLDVARQAAAEYGGLALQLDVSSGESFAAFLDRVVAEYGRLDALVNNAGFMVIGRLHDVPVERQLAQLDVNIAGVVHGCYEAVGRMPDGGVILNVGSLAGRIPTPGTAVYSATKAAVLALTEALDSELRPRGIRTCAVLPSFTNTELIAGTDVGGLTEPIEPTEVADAIVRVLVRPRLFAVVPKKLTFSAASWSLVSGRLKPALLRRFGLDHIFTDPDQSARREYDARTGGSWQNPSHDAAIGRRG